MLVLLTAVLLFPVEESESIKSLLEKAGPGNSQEARIQAIKRLGELKPENPKRLCQTLEQYADDKNTEIRTDVFVTLATIALGAKLACPLPIVLAINDEDENIRDQAGDLAIVFEEIPDAAFPEVVKASKSKDCEVRETAAFILPKINKKSAEAMKILKTLLDDPNEFVRYNAHISYFNATEDISARITYLLEYTSQLNNTPPAITKAQKRDESRRNLVYLGVAMYFYHLSRTKPKYLAKELIANLSHKDPRVRQSALLQIRGMCISSHESYDAIPKLKAKAAVSKLLDDENEEVSTWASMAMQHLKEGPPPDAPQKMKPLNADNYQNTESKTQPGDKP